MFARVLYQDEERSLRLNWLGMGALLAVNKFGGVRRAHPQHRSYFLALVSALEQHGIAIAPSSKVFTYVCKTFAELVETAAPNSLHWQVMTSRTPAEYAAELVADANKL